ncbi:MAG TPA: response regulator transcription factor, partial [Opitutaceae bacterium]|nr:response regulator transcription factor [Opitutaceae bacterium]
AGALGCLQKSTSRHELIQAVKRIARGGRWLAPDVSARLRALRLAPAITVREREILAMIATGHGNKSIAGALQISEDTVKRHVSHILDKLDVNDRAEATAVAIRRGILKVS